jgi:hypothetical protein
MTDIKKQAEPTMQGLLQSPEEQLFEQLGLRAQAISQDITLAGSFAPQVVYSEAEMGVKEALGKVGRRLFRRWNKEAYKLLCGDDPEDKEQRTELQNAIGAGDVAVAAALTSALVYIGAAPALAAIIAAIIVKKFFAPAYEEFCVLWKESFD